MSSELEARIAKLELFARVTLARGLEKLVIALANQAVLSDKETELQEQVRDRLLEFGIPFQEQFVLSKDARLDFLAYVLPPPSTGGLIEHAIKWQRIAVELKVKGSQPELIRQLDHYAQSSNIDALLVVTTKMQLTRVPSELQGKPVAAVWMGSL